MDGLQGKPTRSRRLLEKGNADHIDNSNEETETEGDDQNRLLLTRETQMRQDRHREKEDGQVGDDVDGGRGQVKRDDVGAVRAGRTRDVVCRGDRIALEDVDKGQDEACNIDHGEGNVVCPSENLLVACQGQVEDEDGSFDGHQRGVLARQYILHRWLRGWRLT